MPTERVRQVEDGGGVEVPRAAEATVGDAGGDIAEDEGETHTVVDDQRQDHQQLHRGAEKAEGLVEGHGVVLLHLSGDSVGLHVRKETQGEDGHDDGEDDEEHRVVVREVLDDTADERAGEAAELEDREEHTVKGRCRLGET